MSGQKEYFVFISYSNTDKEWAEWLQDELEHYKLPAAFNGRNDVRDNLRDVFRDRDELSAGYDWDEQVEQALSGTCNLVVVCSPSAARSDAVNREIEIFIQQGKGNRIFPFIVSGDSPKECFPPALSHKKIGGDINKDGSCNKAFAKVVAGILGVSFDSIWQRYEQEKARKERELRAQRNNLYRVQSRLMAEKAQQMLDEGNGLRATLVLMNALPERIDDPEDKPLVAEAERLLRSAIGEKTADIWIKIHPCNLDYYISNRVLLTHRDDIVSFFNIDTGDCTKMELNIINLRRIVISPSRTLFACISCFDPADNIEGEVCICDFQDKKVLYRHHWGDDWEWEVNQVMFSRDEKRLLIESEWGRYIYDFAADKIYGQGSYDENDRRQYLENITEFSLDEFEDEYYAKMSGNILKIFKSSTHECVAFAKDCFKKGSVVSYNPSDASFVYQEEDGTLKSLNIATLRVKTFDCKVTGVVALAKMLPETNEILLLLRETDKEWDDFGKRKLKVIRNDRFVKDELNSRVLCCRFCLNSKFVAGIIRDKESGYCVGFWYVEGDKHTFIAPDYTIAQSEIEMCNMVISPDGNTIAVYYVNNIIRIYSVFDGECIETFKPHKDVVNDIVFSPCGRYFATTSDDCTIKICDAVKYSNICTIRTSTAVQNLQFDKNGEYIVGVHSSSAKLYSVKSGKSMRTFKTGANCFKAEFSPCGRYVVTCTRASIKVFELTSGECVNKIAKNLRVTGEGYSYADEISDFIFINDAGDFIMRYFDCGCYRGNIASAEIERIKDEERISSRYSKIERSNDGEYLLFGCTLLQRSESEVQKAESENDWPFGPWRILDYIEKGVLDCYRESEDSGKLGGSIYNGNLRLIVDKRCVSVFDEVLQKTIDEFCCISKGENVVEAAFSEDGESVIFISETYSGKRIYHREFKPIQVLIDQVRARYSQSELTEEERVKCYLD